MIEDRLLPGPDLAIESPVAELHAVIHDPSLTHLMRLRDGRRLTASDLQWSTSSRRASTSRTGTAPMPTTPTRTCWSAGSPCWPGSASDPMLLPGELDWVAKLRLLEGYRARDGLDWDVAAAAARRPAVRRRAPGQGPLPPARGPGPDGAPVHRGAGEPGDDRTARRTPAPTSAAAACVSTRRGGGRVLGLGDLRRPGRESLQRVPTLEPLRGTQAHVGELLDESETASGLVDRLTAPR